MYYSAMQHRKRRGQERLAQSTPLSQVITIRDSTEGRTIVLEAVTQLIEPLACERRSLTPLLQRGGGGSVALQPPQRLLASGAFFTLLKQGVNEMELRS